MKQLELQQEAEEAALASGASLPVTDSTKSMPATRRHSGEINGNGVAAVAAGKEVVGEVGGKRGEQNMLNNFTFDDELDADLQSEFNIFFIGISFPICCCGWSYVCERNDQT